MKTCRNTLYKSVTTTTINFPKYFFFNQKMLILDFEHGRHQALCAFELYEIVFRILELCVRLA